MLKANGFGCLMDHLGSIWNALGILLFSLVKETDAAAEKAVLVQWKTHLPLTKSYMFHFAFLST